ncbi:MAG: ABC transporter permease [Cyclobacteriaceae bacterium]|nr:ABC transporter permease [Cyclobacteriaceae bacterium]
MKSIGKYFIFIGSLFKNRETFRTYVGLFFDESVKVGTDSIFLIAIVSVFMGAVTTIQTAYNLVSPLIPDYVVALVVRDMVLLELSPTIIAIIFAGKVGSNIAGELGTMRITEQIDALEVMGLNSSSYLVLPKVLATIFMFPALVITSAFLSILGGYVATVFTGVITPFEYIQGIRYHLNEFMVTFAMIKSVTFAFLISSISSYMGYYTKGGALEVGKASTAAVTNSVIAILLADYLLAQLLAEYLISI